MTLTDSDLQRAKEMCEKATPGPWQVAGPWPHVTVYVDIGSDDSVEPIQVADVFRSWKNEHHEWELPSDQSNADASFIAAARTLVPQLIDLVEAQRKEIAAWRERQIEFLKRWDKP